MNQEYIYSNDGLTRQPILYNPILLLYYLGLSEPVPIPMPLLVEEPLAHANYMEWTDDDIVLKNNDEIIHGLDKQ